MIVRFLIWFLFIFIGVIGGLIIDLNSYIIKIFNKLIISPVFHIITFFIGIYLLRFILIATRYTGKYLAKFGKEGEVKKFEVNKFVDSDIYGCMRHPMHFALLFFPLSIGLITGIPSFIFIIAPIEALLIILLIKFIEEPEAIKKFGNKYIEYKKRVPMFSLKRDCLKKYFQKIQ